MRAINKWHSFKVIINNDPTPHKDIELLDEGEVVEDDTVELDNPNMGIEGQAALVKTHNDKIKAIKMSFMEEGHEGRIKLKYLVE